VLERMTKALSEVQAGLPVRSDDRETVAAYLHRWLAASAAQRIRPRPRGGDSARWMHAPARNDRLPEVRGASRWAV